VEEMKMRHLFLIAVIAAMFVAGPVMAQDGAGQKSKESAAQEEKKACLEKCESKSSLCEHRCGRGLGAERYERDHCLYLCSRKYRECKDECRGKYY